jgi:hypothetical protein
MTGPMKVRTASEWQTMPSSMPTTAHHGHRLSNPQTILSSKTTTKPSFFPFSIRLRCSKPCRAIYTLQTRFQLPGSRVSDSSTTNPPPNPLKTWFLQPKIEDRPAKATIMTQSSISASQSTVQSNPTFNRQLSQTPSLGTHRVGSLEESGV